MAGKPAPVALHIFSISCDKSKKTYQHRAQWLNKDLLHAMGKKITMTIQGVNQLQTARKTIAAWWFEPPPRPEKYESIGMIIATQY